MKEKLNHFQSHVNNLFSRRELKDLLVFDGRVISFSFQSDNRYRSLCLLRWWFYVIYLMIMHLLSNSNIDVIDIHFLLDIFMLICFHKNYHQPMVKEKKKTFTTSNSLQHEELSMNLAVAKLCHAAITSTTNY